MTIYTSAFGLGFLLLAVVVVVGFPLTVTLWLLHWKRWANSISRRPWRNASIGTTVAYRIILATYLVWIGPWRSGIVVAGQAADGREYAVVQSFQDIAEPFRVTLFVRTDGGLWRSYYLEHEDNGWRSASVDVIDGVAHVKRNGVPFRDVPLATAAVDPASVPLNDREPYRPASFTLADLARTHRYGLNSTRDAAHY